MRSYEEARAVASRLGRDRGQTIKKPLSQEPEQQEADRRFLDAWVRAWEAKNASEEERAKLFPNILGAASLMGPKHIFVDPKRDLQFQVDVPPGLYDPKAVLEAALKFIGRKKIPRWNKFDWTPYLVHGPFVALDPYRSGWASLITAALPDGTLIPIPHLVKGIVAPGMVFNNKGQVEGAVTGEQYLKLLPAIHYCYRSENPMYTFLAWDESLAEDFDRAPQVLASFRDMLRLLPQVTVEGAAPCLARYVGFTGEMQSSGTLWNIDEPYAPGTNNLLFDGKAWLLRLAIDGKPLTGRVLALEDGKFIVSEWCFREITYGMARRRESRTAEMYNGSFNKHNLLTWCAGPMLDKFGTKEEYKMKSLTTDKFKARAVILNAVKDTLLAFTGNEISQRLKEDKLEFPCGILFGNVLYYIVGGRKRYNYDKHLGHLLTTCWAYMESGEVNHYGDPTPLEPRYWEGTTCYHVPGTLAAMLFDKKLPAKEVLPEVVAEGAEAQPVPAPVVQDGPPAAVGDVAGGVEVLDGVLGGGGGGVLPLDMMDDVTEDEVDLDFAEKALMEVGPTIPVEKLKEMLGIEPEVKEEA